jgi:serine/threonine-protein kinase
VSDDLRRTRSDPLIGKQLGDYQIVSRLASGGMARIYKGIDTKLDREAAVKVLNLDRFELDTSILERFEREARAVAKLEHEHIIPIYQYGKYEAEGVYFLAMKLIEGRNLAHEMRDIHEAGELMKPARALNIMAQIALAVDFAHSKGFIHRDIKPSNILIAPEDKAILTDLGLVLRPASETTLGTAFGTPRYIAPEQASSSDRAVNQSMWWASPDSP